MTAFTEMNVRSSACVAAGAKSSSSQDELSSIEGRTNNNIGRSLCESQSVSNIFTCVSSFKGEVPAHLKSSSLVLKFIKSSTYKSSLSLRKRNSRSLWDSVKNNVFGSKKLSSSESQLVSSIEISKFFFR